MFFGTVGQHYIAEDRHCCHAPRLDAERPAAKAWLCASLYKLHAHKRARCLAHRARAGIALRGLRLLWLACSLLARARHRLAPDGGDWAKLLVAARELGQREEGRWLRMRLALLSFVTSCGAYPSKARGASQDEKVLAEWVQTQRKAGAAMDGEQRDALEALPGWEWQVTGPIPLVGPGRAHAWRVVNRQPVYVCARRSRR